MQAPELRDGAETLRGSRRRLVFDTLGIAVSAGGFGLVYGLAARSAGLSTVEVAAMSALVFSGGALFAALGYIAAGATSDSADRGRRAGCAQPPVATPPAGPVAVHGMTASGAAIGCAVVGWVRWAAHAAGVRGRLGFIAAARQG